MEEFFDYGNVYDANSDAGDDIIDFGSFSKTRVGLVKNYTARDYEDVYLCKQLQESFDGFQNLGQNGISSDDDSDEEDEQTKASKFKALCRTNFDKGFDKLEEEISRNPDHTDVALDMQLLYTAKSIAFKKLFDIFAYKRRPYDKDDYLLTDAELIDEEINFIHSTFELYKKKVHLCFAPYIETASLFASVSTVGMYAEHPLTVYLSSENIVLHVLRNIKLESISVFKQELEKYYTKSDPESEAYAEFVDCRTNMLSGLGCSIEEITDILATEDKFIRFKAAMKGKKFRRCPLIDDLSDKKCVELFGFRKKHIKLLARIFDIPPHYEYTRRYATIDTSNVGESYKYVTKTVKCCPIVQLCVFLFRQAHSATLSLCETLFGFEKTKINDIEKGVCNHIYQHFSHLLCISNCTYSATYLSALVKKSTLNGSDVKPNTCYLIDEHHIRICSPTRIGYQNEDVTYTGSNDNDSLAFQVVTDLFGLIIEAGEPQIGSTRDMRLFDDSGLASRIGLLNYMEEPLRMLGDAAYCSYNSSVPEQLDFVEKKSNVKDFIKRKIQNNNLRIRCSVERTLELYKNTMKSLDIKNRNKVFQTDLPPQFLVNALILNAKQILYKTTTSNVLTNIIPIDFYFLRWGMYSDKTPLYRISERHKEQIHPDLIQSYLKKIKEFDGIE